MSWCARWKKKGFALRFLDVGLRRAQACFLGLVEPASKTGFVVLHHAVHIAVCIGTHARLLACGEMLAGAPAVAVVVHFAIADRRARLDLAHTARFHLRLRAPG